MLAEKIAEEVARYVSQLNIPPKRILISKSDLDSLQQERPDFVTAASVWGLKVELVPEGSPITVAA